MTSRCREYDRLLAQQHHPDYDQGRDPLDIASPEPPAEFEACASRLAEIVRSWPWRQVQHLQSAGEAQRCARAIMEAGDG